MAEPVLHGYYRATDIFWEWQKVLPEEVVTPMKSFIHSESITSPHHPFYNPTLGGVELSIGVLPDNESRLLFSSKQIEYLRYWLKAMGLVDYLIPIPHSDCLLTKDVLRSVAPVVIKNPSDMKKTQKNIDKTNKRLRGGIDEQLAAMRQVFERVRAAYGACKGTWIAADFEAWERAHEYVTEFGFTEMKWLPASDQAQEVLLPSGSGENQSGEKTAPQLVNGNDASSQKLLPTITRTGHWIVKENQSLMNGIFCDNNRDVRYAFGTSEVLPRAEIVKRIRELIQPPNQEGPIFLIFHDHSQDIKYLVDPKYRLEVLPSAPTLIVPETPPNDGLYVIDTSQMFAALEGDRENRRKLESVYRKLTHKTQTDFHNAGNDARYTLEILQEMATGGPLDAQREQRWPPPALEPGQPLKKTVKVEDWAPEDASDYEDMETILGIQPGWVDKDGISAIKGVEQPKSKPSSDEQENLAEQNKVEGD
ncbi:hypothetical protein CPB86DRAFT_782613 [Serendipita vermifera]|nr:hypothetical protein CPB86DRAFT_782613 [Serendipita vermifera]